MTTLELRPWFDSPVTGQPETSLVLEGASPESGPEGEYVHSGGMWADGQLCWDHMPTQAPPIVCHILVIGGESLSSSTSEADGSQNSDVGQLIHILVKSRWDGTYTECRPKFDSREPKVEK